MSRPLDEHARAHFVAPPPDSACRLCVIIPVRDEAQTLAATLASLAAQRRLDGRPLPAALYEVILLANNCTDGSASVARRFAGTHPALRLHVVERDLPEPHAHVGYARRLLMDEACRRLLALGCARGVIASTDADTRVGPTWVAATLAEVAHGADVVGGRILVDPDDLRAETPLARRLHLQDVTYRWLASRLDARYDPDPLDPWPRHFQHFGASLAVTADAYLRAGGMPIQPWLEDVAFAANLARAGCGFRHSPLVRVVTSGRRLGRTPFGYAGQLDLWESMAACRLPNLVPSPASLAIQARARRALRRLWLQPTDARLHAVAAALQFAPDQLALQLRRQATFGALIDVLGVPQIPSGVADERWPLVEIGAAISELRALLAAGSDRVPSATLEHVEPPGLLAAAG